MKRDNGRKAIYEIVEDTQRHYKAKEEGKGMFPEAHGHVSANVGEIMAVAMAEAGAYAFVLGGRKACETDYLAAQGASFPEVTNEEMMAFNRKTMKKVMEEEDEWRRYAEIAMFFKRK